MASVNLQLDSFSLQTSNIITREILHDSSTVADLETLEISRQDGEKLISSTYRPKSITVAGIIKGSTQADLEERVDNFKLNIRKDNASLDIAYAGGVRRYLVSTRAITINRNFFHLEFCPFSIEFEVLDPPFGYQASALGGEITVNETLSADGATGSIYEDTITFEGTAPPRPLIRYVVDTHTGLSQVVTSNKGTNQQITIATAFTSGDQVIIDTAELSVRKNQVRVNYTGFFPEFSVGSNIMVTKLLGTDAQSIDLQNTSISSEINNLQNSDLAFGMRFQTATTTTFPLVELSLRRGSSQNLDDYVTLNVEIRTHDATNNRFSGTVVANATATIDVTNIPKSGFGWVQARFSTPPSLTAATDYWIVVYATETFAGLTSPTYWIRANTFENNSSYDFIYKSGAAYFLTTGKGFTFKLYKTYSAAAWSIDRRVDYSKRYL